jgi:hypothetical protein
MSLRVILLPFHGVLEAFFLSNFYWRALGNLYLASIGPSSLSESMLQQPEIGTNHGVKILLHVHYGVL